MSDNRIKVIDKMIEILLLFLEEKRPLGVSYISKNLKIYKSSVFRILKTLQSRGFIKQGENKKYWLGSKFYSLGMLYKNESELADLTNRYLKQLSNKINETVHLAVFDEIDYRKVVVINNIATKQRLGSSPAAGSRNPTHASALGKVLLAYSSDEIIETILSSSLKKFTENTITDKEKLKEELKEIRKRGYAVDREELEEGLVCYAAPIFERNNKYALAGLSVTGPGSRIYKKKDELINEVKYTARLINSEL